MEDGGVGSNPIAIRVNRSVKMGVHFAFLIFWFIYFTIRSSNFFLTIWIRLLNTEKDEIFHKIIDFFFFFYFVSVCVFGLVERTGRSLQAWQQHGRPHSELLRLQRDSEGGSTLGGPLRYDADRTLIFWVQCQQVKTKQNKNKKNSPTTRNSQIQISLSPFESTRAVQFSWIILKWINTTNMLDWGKWRCKSLNQK